MRALSIFLLWFVVPVANAAPILSSSPFGDRVVGWENELGTFLFDTSEGTLIGGSAGGATSSYESGIYRSRSTFGVWLHTGVAEGGLSQILDPHSGLALIVAHVENDETSSGNLISGQLVVRATADQTATDGTLIKEGEVLMKGIAIDSYAGTVDYLNFLFRITFLHSSISDFGRYVTYNDPQAGFFQCGVVDNQDPWGCDVSESGSWTDSDFVTVNRIAEPHSLALLIIALLGIHVSRKRDKA